MNIKSTIYGAINITEPVILELLESPSILRLKNVSQFGVPDKYYHLKGFSRWEHSVGVMTLLRKLGADIEEQVAGLLHDVSTTAFSHVADWIFNDKERSNNEDYHDSIHEEFIKNTEIPNILEKYGFDAEKLIDNKNFSLLERDIPDLCADRIDYSLREFKHWFNPKIVDSCINSLKIFNNEIIFNDSKIAYIFANNFLTLQIKHWSGYESMMRYYLFSRVIKRALNVGLITKQDFHNDEDEILNKLENTLDTEIQDILKLLLNKNLKKLSNQSENKIIKKFRFVDPKVLINGEIKRLSQINQKFFTEIKKAEVLNKEGLLV